MHRIDPLSPGRRVAIDAADADVAALSDAFNRMLERLENERRDSSRSALAAQEAERRRVAGELHDEVGQSLTAMLLQVERVTAGLPAEQRGELDELRETARAGAHDVRRIAQRLRPDGLEELGLRSALLALATAFASEARVPIDGASHAIFRSAARTSWSSIASRKKRSPMWPAMRALSTRRSGSTRNSEPSCCASAMMAAASTSSTGSSSGIRGMRERAMVIGAELAIHSIADRGTEVVLRIPTRRRR